MKHRKLVAFCALAAAYNAGLIMQHRKMVKAIPRLTQAMSTTFSDAAERVLTPEDARRLAFELSKIDPHPFTKNL